MMGSETDYAKSSGTLYMKNPNSNSFVPLEVTKGIITDFNPLEGVSESKQAAINFKTRLECTFNCNTGRINPRLIRGLMYTDYDGSLHWYMKYWDNKLSALWGWFGSLFEQAIFEISEMFHAHKAKRQNRRKKDD